MRVSLDTNVLHQEGFKSQSMRLLHRLVEAGFLELFLSRMVLREYDSKRKLEVSSKLQSARDNLQELNKSFSKSGIKLGALSILESEILRLLPDLDASRESAMQDWLDDFKVSVIDADLDTYNHVWDDYFSGYGAFKRAKNRDDIPDAVIARSLERLARDGNGLAFICKDGQLKKFMSEVPGVQVFTELSEFISSPFFVEKLGELDSHNKVIESFKSAISSEVFQGCLLKYLCAADSDFQYAIWQGDEIEGKSELPLNVYGSPIAKGLDASSIDRVEFGPVACIHARHYVVPMTFSADAHFEFVADYAEWLHAREDVKAWVEVLSADGDGLCKFSVQQSCDVSGQINIHFLEDLSAEDFMVHAKYIGVEDSPLDVEFIPVKLQL